ncbi:hypothetical protein KM043_007984 [Ampulex compressa]|nr:hypothetical protein KM043_007984 [Ampulex compressa]
MVRLDLLSGAGEGEVVRRTRTRVEAVAAATSVVQGGRGRAEGRGRVGECRCEKGWRRWREVAVGKDHEINMYVGGYGPRGSGVASNPRQLIGQRPP